LDNLTKLQKFSKLLSFHGNSHTKFISSFLDLKLGHIGRFIYVAEALEKCRKNLTQDPFALG
jgi:hypothetical protein